MYVERLRPHMDDRKYHSRHSSARQSCGASRGLSASNCVLIGQPSAARKICGLQYIRMEGRRGVKLAERTSIIQNVTFAIQLRAIRSQCCGLHSHCVCFADQLPICMPPALHGMSVTSRIHLRDRPIHPLIYCGSRLCH